MGVEEIRWMNTDSSMATIRRHRRWIVSLGAAFFVTLLLVSNRHHAKPARERASAWLTHAEYSPYSHTDTLAHFKQDSTCHVSSPAIYQPTKHLCPTRQSTLRAMSSGGRVGFDAPYQTRDCDMRWYSTSEICSILSKFDAIHIVGDSMMRSLAVAIMVFLREDLIDGGRTTWKTGNPDGLDCRCRETYPLDCWAQGYVVTDTADVWAKDPTSMKCPRSIADINFQWSARDPADPAEIDIFKNNTRGKGSREAFVFGNGVWESFETEGTQRWISDFEGALKEKMPGFVRPPPAARPSDAVVTLPKMPGAKSSGKESAEPDPHKVGVVGPAAAGVGGVAVPAGDVQTPPKDGNPTTPDTKPPSAKIPRSLSLSEPPPNDAYLEKRATAISHLHPPRLFLTPNAQSLGKPADYVPYQNNIRLISFEREITSWLQERGWDTVGTYNLTVQSTSVDGTHNDMESNLAKAMMVFNWLEWVGKEM